MRKTCLLLVAFLTFAIFTKAQDVITLTNGTQVQAKVLEINPGDIRYKEYNNPDGPTITILKSTVASIQYANGAKTLFNEQKGGSQGGGHFVKGDGSDRNRDGNEGGGYKRKREKNARLHGWYLGAGVGYGASGAGNSDPSYSTSANIYTGGSFSAAKMFNQHIGIQFGLSFETYNYDVEIPGVAYSSDVFSVFYVTLPVRAIYFSNSKKRAGLYAMAGLDISLGGAATDREGDNISDYYNTVLISPYLSSGVAFRNRYARMAWMFGLYYKTSINNFYSGNTDNSGTLRTGNTGTVHSVGLAISMMTKIGRGR